MRDVQPNKSRGTVVNRISECRCINRAEDNTSKVDWTGFREKSRGSIHITRIRQSEAENRPANQSTARGPGPHWMRQSSFGKRPPPSLFHQLPLIIYNRGATVRFLTRKTRACRPDSRTEGASPQVFRGSPGSSFREVGSARLAAINSSKELRFHSPESRAEGALSQILRGSPGFCYKGANIACPVAINSNKTPSLQDKTESRVPRVYRHPTVPMARQEQCFHCRDLQAEFDEVRAQQKALEEQVRSLEARLEEQCKIIHEKYRAEMNLLLHRVHSLHEQFSNLSNRCSHAEEKISILKFIMDKKFKDATSSSSAKPIEPDLEPEGSTARKISHIDIDSS